MLDSDETDNDVEFLPNVKRKRSNSSQLPKRLKKTDVHEPPIAEELNQWTESEHDSSNLFGVKIAELLAEVKVSREHKGKIRFWVQNFEQFALNLTQCTDVQLDEIVKNKGRKNLTYHQKFINQLFAATIDIICDENLTLSFGKPESFKVLGAHGLGCSINLDLQIDISLKIPANYFHKEDYLNNRYAVKCYYYLVYIYVKLKETVLCSKIDIVFCNGIKSLPFLQVVPNFYEGNVFNIYVSGSENSLLRSQLQPNKNNINFDTDVAFHDVDVTTFSEHGTPLYNSVIAKDLTLHQNYSDMEYTLKARNVQDACMLIQVWLRQRNLIKGFGNFSVDTVFYGLMYLFKRGTINQSMNSCRIVREFWSFLCCTNWSRTPISLCDGVEEDKLNSYKNNYRVVFLDKTGDYNVTSFLNLDVYLKVRREAELAICMLNANTSNAFSSLFNRDIPFIFQYDFMAKINDDHEFRSVYKSMKDIRKWNFYGFYATLVIEELVDIMKQGFGAGARAVVPYITEMNAYTTNINSFKTHLTFGVILNPKCALNPSRFAPSDQKAKVAEFQSFWKNHSDYLPLNDVTFSEDFPKILNHDRKHIFQQYLTRLLSDDLNLSVYVISDQFEKVLDNRNGKCAIEENCNNIREVYIELNKILRSLTLSLSISRMHGTSDIFSCTELIPPCPVTPIPEIHITPAFKNCLTIKQKNQYNTIPKYVYPVECVIELENFQWSSDIKVLRSLKLLFYFEICTLLKQKHGIQSKIDENHIDVFYKGLIFRIKLYIPKEVQLLKQIGEDAISYEDNNTESLSLEIDLEILPKVSTALSRLSSKIPTFGLCCVLVKRWLRSQLLDGSHISDTVINLLCSSLYLNSTPFEKAMLPQIGFLRFLKFTSEPDWYNNPIIVNFDDELDRATLNELIAKYYQKKGHRGLCIIMPYDSGRSVFSQSDPTLNILTRMTMLATESCKFVNQNYLEWKAFDIKNLFVPNLTGYKVLIYLKENLNPLGYMQVALTNQPKSKSPKLRDATKPLIPITNFNPVDLYLRELRETFGDVALFFHDTYGGNLIGVLWTHQALKEKEYKLENVRYTKFYNNKLILNTELIVADFAILGEGVVQNIVKL